MEVVLEPERTTSRREGTSRFELAGSFAQVRGLEKADHAVSGEPRDGPQNTVHLEGKKAQQCLKLLESSRA